MSHPDDRIRMAEILDEISKIEHQKGHPLFSVVVVQNETDRPGKGFYKLPRRLGLFSWQTNLHEMEFFVSTVKDATGIGSARRNRLPPLNTTRALIIAKNVESRPSCRRKKVRI
jgi:hypothetical protein